MGLITELLAAWREAIEGANAPRQGSQPRDLTSDDRLAWDLAIDERLNSMTPRTVEDVRALIRHRNPVRWRQVQKDLRWVQKEMKRIGLNPEDARYII